MKTRLILALLISCGLFTDSAMASRIVSKEEAAAARIKYIQMSKVNAIALRAEADLVFVGRLAGLTSRDETQQSETGISKTVQIHEAVFDRVNNIKGAYADGQAVAFSSIKNRVEIGGTSTFKNERMPIENSTGQRFLVYAKAGKILRTNHIPMVHEVLSGPEEELVLLTTPE